MRLIFIVLLFMIAGCAGGDKKAPANEPMPEPTISGDILFKANCASCHKPDIDFTGPALKGALQRWGGDKEEMYKFIRSPFKSVQENAYAKQLFEKWNRTIMTPFDLTDAQIDSIINYCENYKATN